MRNNFLIPVNLLSPPAKVKRELAMGILPRISRLGRKTHRYYQGEGRTITYSIPEYLDFYIAYFIVEMTPQNFLLNARNVENPFPLFSY
jgi:hypothetical protein